MASLIQVSPKRRRACFPPLLEPQYYDLDPSLAQTLKPKMSSANISKAKNFLRSDVEIVLANPEMSIADHCSVEADPFDVGVYGSQEKIDILYGFTALPVVPLPLIDDPLIPIHQAPMAIKVEAVEANHVAPPPGFESVGEMREKIKDLEAQLFFARQAGVEDFKKSQEFEQSALQYIHKNLEAFVSCELCDESRRKGFYRALNANPTWRAKKIREELETDDYYKRKWEMQKSIYDYERLMLEFDGINANRQKIPRNLAGVDVGSSSTPPALDH
nr:hypothetical protein Iba_chr10aCG7110 [Ipomoea batatas]GMD46573.1 hypothetical protein Iba_chr10eCG4580 [Ipomoea batatas]